MGSRRKKALALPKPIPAKKSIHSNRTPEEKQIRVERKSAKVALKEEEKTPLVVPAVAPTFDAYELQKKGPTKKNIKNKGKNKGKGKA